MNHDEIRDDTLREVAAALKEEIGALQMVQEMVPTREVALAITNIQQGLLWLREAGNGSWYDTPGAGKEQPQ